MAAATPTTAPPNPAPTATSAPADDPPSLTTYWARLRMLEFTPAIDHLEPLPPAQRADPHFGVADALSAGDAAGPILRGMGAAVDRLELRWDQLEPAPNVYDFSSLDETLKMNSRLGFGVLAVVDGTPAWASADGARDANAPPVGLDLPALLPNGAANPANPWASFLTVLATRYRTQISAWEIWNEPNTAAFWAGTPPQYAALFAVAQAALHRAAPGEPVILGGMVGDNGRFLRAVVGALCSVQLCPAAPAAVAWHVYDNPLDIPRLAKLTGETLAPYGKAPAIWITEANVPVDDPRAPADAVVGPDAVSLDRQAAFVAQAYALALASGVRTLAIYRASDVDDAGHYWGLIRGDYSARPALLAYRTAAALLGGARFRGLSHPTAGVTVADFCSSAGPLAVLWNDLPQAVSVPSAVVGGKATSDTGAPFPLTDQRGVWRVILPAAALANSATVPLGAPVYVTGKGSCA